MNGTEPWFMRFMSHVLIGDGCWAWTGWKTHDGYGGFTLNAEECAGGGPSTLYAHRELYSLMVGPIPEGYQVDHLCYNVGCCNTDHLEAVTKLENLKRRRGLCRQGHTMVGENVKVMGVRNGRVYARCRICYEEKRSKDRIARTGGDAGDVPCALCGMILRTRGKRFDGKIWKCQSEGRCMKRRERKEQVSA